jgi:hypothetical protein
MAIKKDQLLEKRAKFVKDYIQSNNKKGVKVSHSVSVLSERVLFVTERTIYNDLSKQLKY